MLNIRDLKIDTASLGKPLLLVEVRPYLSTRTEKPWKGSPVTAMMSAW